MRNRVGLAIAAAAVLGAGVVIYAVSGDKNSGRQAAIGSTPPTYPMLIGATAVSVGFTSDVVFTSDGQVKTVIATGGPVSSVPWLSAGGIVPPVGPMIISDGTYPGDPNSGGHWVAKGTAGDGRIPAAVPDTLAAWVAGPVYLSRDESHNRTDVKLYDVGTGVTSTLGSITGPAIAHAKAIANTDGIAIIDQDASPAAGYYVAYQNGSATALNFGVNSGPSGNLSCQSITGLVAPTQPVGALGCVSGGSGVLRVPLNGSAPRPVIAAAAERVVVTPTATVWLDRTSVTGDDYLRSQPATGGSTTTAALKYSSLIGSASGALFAYSARSVSASMANIYRLDTVGSTPVPVVHPTIPVGAAPPDSLAVAPMRAGDPVNDPSVARAIDAWQTTGRITWRQRSLTRDQYQLMSATYGGRPLNVKGLFTIDIGATDNVSVSGPRTVIGGATSIRVLDAGSATPDRPVSYPTTGGLDPQISGMRVLLRGANKYLDLTTGTFVDLSSLTMRDGGAGAALWGNTLVYVAADGRLMKKNLAAPTAPVAVSLGSATGVAGGIRASEDHILACTGSGCVVDGSMPIFAADHQFVSMGPDGIVASGGCTSMECGNYNFRLFPYGNAAPVNIGIFDFALQTTLQDGVFAWLDPLSELRLWAWPQAPLPTLGPRAIGLPLAPRSVVNGTSWTMEQVASAPLTSCSVSIKAGSTVVRTLACDPARTGMGSARAVWNLKDANGVAVAPGTYSWSLDAGVRAADSYSPLGGTVTVQA